MGAGDRVCRVRCSTLDDFPNVRYFEPVVHAHYGGIKSRIERRRTLRKTCLARARLVDKFRLGAEISGEKAADISIGNIARSGKLKDAASAVLQQGGDRGADQIG